MAIRTYILIITLNVNGLSASTKRDRLTEWIQKRDLYICCVQETRFRPGTQTENEGMEKYIPCKQNQKNAGVAIYLSDKINFEIKIVIRDKEGCYTTIKRSIQEDKTIINIYAHNIGATQYVKQMLTSIKGEINSSIIILGDLILHSHLWIDQ